MATRLFVRNLPSEARRELLEDLFSSVADVEMTTFGDADPKTGLKTAYVKMTTEQGTVDSIERFNGYVCDGQRLVVTRDEPHRPDPTFKSRRKKLS